MRIISMVLKKIVLYPVIAVVTIMQYVMIFVGSIAAGFIDLLAAVVVLAAIALFTIEVVSGAEMVLMLMVASVVFMIPFIGQGFVTLLEKLRGKLLANAKQTL